MLKFCRKYIYEKPGLFAFYLASITLKTVLGYIGILLSGKFIDALTGSPTMETLKAFCMAVAGVGLLSLVLNVITGYTGSVLQTRQAYSCSRDLYQKITRLPLSFIKEQDMAYMSQRINSDSNILVSFFVDTYISLYFSAISMIVSFAMILKIEYKTAIVLIVLAAVYGVMYRAFKGPIYKSTKAYKEDSADFFGRYYECMDSVEFAKNHSIKDVFLGKMDASFNKLYRSFISFQKVQLSMGACDGMISAASNIVVYIICGIAIINGNVSIGLFTVVLNLFGNIASSVRFFLDYGKVYQETKVSYGRITAINDLKDETCGELSPSDCKAITVDNITFGYDKIVIDRFSQMFRKGNIYYIIGGNGAGKTTLISLMLGNYKDSMQGTISLDGESITDIDLYDAKKKLIGYSEQDTYLVSGSIRDNLELFKKDDAALKTYTEAFRLFDKAGDNGLSPESRINVQQNNLSGGEKQKISIIRQLIQNPEIMIFDEPTANLEPDIKNTFADILQSVKKDKIIIVVTHDVGIIRHGDIVVKM